LVGSRWWMVAALAITTTAGYGVLAYAFAVFLVPMQHELGASRTALTVAPAISLLTAAAVAVPVGRWLDRRGGRALMVLGSVLATACVLAWSQVENVGQLYAVSVGLGVASTGVLYEAAFAVVVTWFAGKRRADAILAITLVGGLASTIFLPLTGFLVESYGWRQALVVLAVVYGAVTIPLHLVVRRPPNSPTRPAQSTQPTQPTAPPASAGDQEPARPPAAADLRSQALRTALRDPAYWLIGGVFVAEGIGVFVVSVHLVAYLGDLGHTPTTAASVAGLLGLLSVTGRIVTTAAQRRFRLTSIVAGIFVFQAAGLALLPVVGGVLVGAVACVLAVGFGFGVSTIARPLMVASRYGVAGYATLAGLQAAFLMVSKALAPLAAAWLHAAGGSYTPVMVVSAVASLLGAGGLVVLGRSRR
jgi:predicted MFS family arabinose efflux permease